MKILLSLILAIVLYACSKKYAKNIPQCKENDDDLTNDWFI